MSEMGRKTRAARGLAATLLSASTGLLSTLVLVPIALDYLGPETFGTWTIVFQLVGYAGLLDLGISYAVTRDLAAARAGRSIADQRRLIASGFLLYLGLGSVLLVCGVAVIPLLSAVVGGAEITDAWLLLVVFAAAAFPVRFLGAANLGAQAIAPTNVVGFVQGVTNVIFAILLLRLGIGISALALALVASEAVALVLQLFVFSRHVGLSSLDPRLFSFGSARGLLGFSLQVFVAGLSAGTIVWRVGPLVIGATLGASAVTTYAVNTRVPSQLVALVNLGTDVSMPGFTDIHTRETVAERRSAYLRLAQLVGLASGLSAAGVVVFLRPFVELWVGARYEASLAVVLALAYLVVHHPIQHVCSVVLTSAREVRTFAWVSVIEAAVNITLALVLVRDFGILGVLVATILAGWISLSFVLGKTAEITGLSILAAASAPFGIAAWGAMTGALAEVGVSWVAWPSSWVGLVAHGAIWGVVAISLFASVDAVLMRGRMRWLVGDVLRATRAREGLA